MTQLRQTKMYDRKHYKIHNKEGKPCRLKWHKTHSAKTVNRL